MHRTLIQLDESLYEQLKELAHARRVSLSGVIRELLAKALGRGAPKKKKKMLISQFKFIGSGRSKEHNIAERHDQYLADDILKK
jgi:predicted CopG family antitoxin